MVFSENIAFFGIPSLSFPGAGLLVVGGGGVYYLHVQCSYLFIFFIYFCFFHLAIGFECDGCFKGACGWVVICAGPVRCFIHFGVRSQLHSSGPLGT